MKNLISFTTVISIQMYTGFKKTSFVLTITGILGFYVKVRIIRNPNRVVGTLGNILWNLVDDWVLLVTSFILFVQNIVKLFCYVEVKIKLLIIQCFIVSYVQILQYSQHGK